MKFIWAVLQVNMHRFTEPDFEFDITVQDGDHDVSSYSKVPPQ